MNSIVNFTNQQYGNEKWRFYDNILSRLRCHEQDQHSQLFPCDDESLDPPIFACKFADDGKHDTLLALANEDGKLAVHDIVDSAKNYGIRAHNNAIFDLTWMFGSMKIVTASGDHTAKLFHVCNEDLRETKTFYGHSRSVKAVTCRKEDPSVFASGGRDGNIIIWDTRSDTNSFIGKEDKKITNSHNSKSTPNKARRRLCNASSPSVGTSTTASVTGLVFQNDNTLISCGASDGMIKIWDLRKNYAISKPEPLPKHKIPYAGMTSINGFSNLLIDDSCIRLYASCLDNTIYCYNLNSYSTEPIMQYVGHKNSTFYIKSSLSRDGLYLLSGSSDECAYIWNTKRTKPVVRLTGHTAEVTCVAWCQNEDISLVTCSDDLTHKIWRTSIEESEENWEIIGRGRAETLPITPTHGTKRKTDALSLDSKIFVKPCERCLTPSASRKCTRCSSAKRKCLEEIHNDIKRARELEPRRLFDIAEEKSPIKIEGLPNFVVDGVTPHVSMSPLKRKGQDWLTKLRTERQFKKDFMENASTSSTIESSPKVARIEKVKRGQSPILRYFKIRCDGHSPNNAKNNCGNNALISNSQATQ